MWASRTKDDLIIEVWEKLDCDSVGRAEIEAVEAAIEGRFGKAAVESPMNIARLLADEGAVLRHSEIMDLYLERNKPDPFDDALRETARPRSLSAAMQTLKKLEDLRQTLTSEHDDVRLRCLRKFVLHLRSENKKAAERLGHDDPRYREFAEIDEWLAHWMRTPELFFAWIELRRRSSEFREKFGSIEE